MNEENTRLELMMMNASPRTSYEMGKTFVVRESRLTRDTDDLLGTENIPTVEYCL